MIAAHLAWSPDKRIRREASSGGFCKSFLWGLIAEELVDCAVVSRLRNPRKPETVAPWPLITVGRSAVPACTSPSMRIGGG